MSEAFPQVRMTPLYGVCHYAVRVAYDLCFRGEVGGVENLPKSGPFLIAANHASHLDPPMIGSHVPRQMCFFARKTLWSGRLASWWLDGVGTIPVDRDGGQDVGALKRVLRALADGNRATAGDMSAAITLLNDAIRSLDDEVRKFRVRA